MKKAEKHFFGNRDLQLLLSPIASATIPATRYAGIVASAMSSTSDEDFRPLVDRLLSFGRVRELLNAYQTSLEGIASLPIIRQEISPSKHIDLLVAVLSREKNALKRFAILRDRFEAALLAGSYDAASCALDACQNELGESCWLVRSRILLLSCQEDGGAVQSYCASIKSRPIDRLFSTMVNYFQVLSDSDEGNTIQLLKNLINRNVTEFREAKLFEIASLFSLVFTPSHLSDRRAYYDCLPLLQLFPLVDQYVMLIELMQQGVVDARFGEREFPRALRAFVRFGEAEEIDPMLARIHKTLVFGPEYVQSKLGKELLVHYERGDYESVITLFSAEFQKLESPFSYINLVAKAFAYAGKPPPDTRQNILFDAIAKLWVLYRLEAHHSISENDLWSRTVRFRSLSQNAVLQASIYLALPHRYPRADTRRALMAAGLVCSEVTPMVESLVAAATERAIVCDPIEIASDVCASYRKLKRKLCCAIENDAGEAELNALFDEFYVETPLKKDYYELFSDYCVAKSKIQDLVHACASALVQDENLYACFPMEYLVQSIEKEFSADISSLVVLYFHTKLVSQDKSHLLNELFDEFILASGVVKPSEFLKVTTVLDDIEIVFFRDICNPNVMDCLSCFSSVKELRIERVRILDSLLEKGVINDEERTKEVNELVGQWIVASATNELNSAKISVDDQELQKRLLGEAESLAMLYKQATDDGDDRVTVWGEEGTEGETQHAYLSGSKNSIALRLINIHLDAFLNDPKFGLDKNLSTEIRHGFFSNLMRSRLENGHLITELGNDGVYSTNYYWREVNHLVADDLLDVVDEYLKEFSSEFNLLIEEVEGWMKIRLDPSEKDRAFVYTVSVDEVAELRQCLDASDDAKRISDATMSILWRTTEECLAKIRDRINGEFRDRLNLLFDDLIAKITEAKRGVAFHELMTTIVRTKSDIRDDVTTVAGWFARAPKHQIVALSLEQILAISVNVFKEITGDLEKISISIHPNFSEIQVCGPSIKAFVLAIFNLLDNCYRRSGEGVAVQISLEGTVGSKGVMLEIRNSLSPEVSAELSEKRMADIRCRLDHTHALSLMRTEGGTGLGKASAQIASISEGSGISVDRDSSNFIVRISYALPNTIR